MEQVRFDDEMVLIEQVIDRPSKDDCKNYTNTVWNGKGDVQPYPKRLVAKLLQHYDVWKLHDPETKTAEQAAAAIAAAEAEAIAQREIKVQTAAGENMQIVLVDSVARHYTSSELDVSDEDIKLESEKRGYALHPRLVTRNLRMRFLEAQESGAIEQAEANNKSGV